MSSSNPHPSALPKADAVSRVSRSASQAAVRWSPSARISCRFVPAAAAAAARNMRLNANVSGRTGRRPFWLLASSEVSLPRRHACSLLHPMRHGVVLPTLVTQHLSKLGWNTPDATKQHVIACAQARDRRESH